MRTINVVQNAPKPVIGGAPWHPETLVDLESIDLGRLPIYDSREPVGWRHLYTVRLMDTPESREEVRVFLLGGFQRNPTIGLLRELDSGMFTVLVYEKEAICL